MNSDILNAYQIKAIERLKTGSILCGGVGSGKSRTAIGYFFKKVCNGEIGDDGVFINNKKDLYIITTAKKRDSCEWDGELSYFYLSKCLDLSCCGIKVVIDSWNNISKYCNVCGAFFIFDEQRLVGSGSWVKSFYQISKKNSWMLLTATPGDTWVDYIPVFVANGFYKNRSEFLREHVVFSRFAKYPKIDGYLNCGKLVKLKNQILVNMEYISPTQKHYEYISVQYNKSAYNDVLNSRWNIYENRPICTASEFCYIQRRIVNSSEYRAEKTKEIIKQTPKIIIFYNFDYELYILREICLVLDVPFGEWNGHKHMDIPKSDKWVYLVQYTSGAEGWNCIETNSILFYSQNYSYKILVQSSGRIDRLNTPYSDLYYYHLISDSPIDKAINKAIINKKNFNENDFVDGQFLDSAKKT